MDELDIDDLLECEDIESTAFISSSKQLLSVIDNLVNCIDDRISYKKGNTNNNAYFAGRNGGYYGGAGSGYHQEDLGSSGGMGIHFNNNLDGGYRHKHQGQSISVHNNNHFANPISHSN
ncbi:MAG: hypothetical protein ACMG6E_02805, partial [Candidatus Roizmanbacteria bacterium]